jgi:hypothetical protein
MPLGVLPWDRPATVRDGTKYPSAAQDGPDIMFERHRHEVIGQLTFPRVGGCRQCRCPVRVIDRLAEIELVELAADLTGGRQGGVDVDVEVGGDEVGALRLVTSALSV